MLDERNTWVQFCNGEQAAFRALYDAHYTRLFTWGCKWLGGEAGFVRDNLHDFFIYLWEKRAGLSRDIQVSAYLLTAFKRRLLEQYGKERQLADITELAGFSEQDTAEADAFAAQFLRVSQALASLTPAQREVIELRFLQNMSLNDIAALKKTSLRTVYNLMHRAISQLREEVGKKNFLYLW